MPTEQVHHIVNYLHNYSEKNFILLPGRIPGYKTTSIQLLPSSTTKQKVWEIYQNEASTAHLRNVSRTYFMNIWKTFTPEIVICKPRSDLCFICHQNSSAIIKAANKPESEKAQVLYLFLLLQVTTCNNKNKKKLL